jgi:hypothetical protein
VSSAAKRQNSITIWVPDPDFVRWSAETFPFSHTVQMFDSFLFAGTRCDWVFPLYEFLLANLTDGPTTDFLLASRVFNEDRRFELL